MAARTTIAASPVPLRAKILVIDDDGRIRDLVARFLEGQGLEVSAVGSALGASVDDFDLIVVDRMMPGLPGDEFIRSMRARGVKIPAIMLTAMGDVDSRISGLESGADDYIAKPFEPRELWLRINAILSRAPPARGIRLTSMEENIINYMRTRRGQSVSRDELGREFRLNGRGVDVTIARLRKKIGGGAIETVRNVGYRLV